MESEYHYKNFISAFVSFEEEGENYYDLTELLIAIYLLSKSSLREKASALFDLYNDEAQDELSRIEIEGILNRIAEVVFSYSEKLMDNDEGVSQMHCKLSATRVNLFFWKRCLINIFNRKKNFSQRSTPSSL